MHPDFSLVLQKCASNLSLKHKQPILFSAHVNCKDMSLASTAEMSNNSQDDTEDLVRIVSDDEVEDEEEEEIEIDRRIENGRLHFQKHNTTSLEQDDNISLCSELSVGRENPGEPRPNEIEDEEILDISDTHSNTSNEEMQHSPGPTSVEPTINPFTLANTLRFPVPFGLQSTATTAATNISPFQEEFLRKSHLYAEELMKHQMQLMAAARASAFSLRTNNLAHLQHSQQISSGTSLAQLNPLAKIGQISAALTAAAQQNKPLNHHHHHLHHQHHVLQPSAQQYGVMANDTLAKLSALSKQHSPTSTSQMMSTLNQLQTQMQAHLPGLMNDNNDNLHERALKFSIDNILKADFGRSNSLDSPPHSRKTTQHKSAGQRHKLNTSSSSSTSNTMLSDSLEPSTNSLTHNISPSTQTFSSSLATICTNSNDSSSTAVSSSYSSANGNPDLVKSSPSATPALSPGFSNAAESGGNKNSSTSSSKSEEGTSTSATGSGSGPIVWPAWVYCTRYSDRPSSGRSPRVRKPKTKSTSSSAAPIAEKANSPSSSTSTSNSNNNNNNSNEDKRPRTAFSGSQLARLKHEFNENRYLTEKRRQQLSSELGLNEAQIKIWFQNKRAKLKKSSGVKNPLALQLMAQGLYNHSTIPLTREEEELQELQEREKANNNNMPQPPATSAVSS